MDVSNVDVFFRGLDAVRTDLCSTSAQLWQLHRYETDYGIYDHDSPGGPDDKLALIRMHAMEDTFAYSPLYDRIIKYDEMNIKERFGFTFAEFVSLPRELVVFFFERASKPRESDKKLVETLKTPHTYSTRKK